MLATAALTAENREGRELHGPVGAITSRYQLFPALFWVAAVVLAATVARDILRGRSAADGGKSPLAARSRLGAGALIAGINVAALIALTAGCILVNNAGWREGLAWQDNLRQNQWCITHYESATDSCLALWFPLQEKPVNLRRAAYLRQRRLANFYTASP